MNLQKFNKTLQATQNKKHSLLKIDTAQPLTKQIIKISKYLTKTANIEDLITGEYVRISTLEALNNQNLSEDEMILIKSVFNKTNVFKEIYLRRLDGTLTSYSKEKSITWILRKYRSLKLKNICITDLIRDELLQELNISLPKLHRVDNLKVNLKYVDSNFSLIQSGNICYYSNYKQGDTKEDVIKKIEMRFQSTDKEYQEMQNLIANYVAKLNGVVFQFNEQNRLRNEFSRATVTDRKKQDCSQNDEILKSMDIFKNTDLEVDKDSDKKQLIQFKNHLQTFLNNLKANINLGYLKIRYLGNYKAIGLYVNALKLIAIDLRDTTAVVHEIGHYIDYRMTEYQLSLNDDFSKIIDLYITDLRDKTELEKKINYYSQPTEIFARAFDYYCQTSGIVPQEITHAKTTDYNIIFDNSDLQTEIINYFKKFDLIKQDIKKLLPGGNQEIA